MARQIVTPDDEAGLFGAVLLALTAAAIGGAAIGGLVVWLVMR